MWNPPAIHDQIIEVALEQSEFSPGDEKRYIVSEASVYRLLKAYDLITSPAYVCQGLLLGITTDKPRALK